MDRYIKAPISFLLTISTKHINVTNNRVDEISNYILAKIKNTDIKCLWGTANMFSNPK